MNRLKFGQTLRGVLPWMKLWSNYYLHNINNFSAIHDINNMHAVRYITYFHKKEKKKKRHNYIT